MSRRRTRRILSEALESRRMLSVSAQISVLNLGNYTGSSSAADIAAGIGTVYVKAGTALNVSAVSTDFSDTGTETSFNSFGDLESNTTDPKDAVKSQITWNFGESSNSHN